jgi:hypothetical protein
MKPLISLFSILFVLYGRPICAQTNQYSVFQREYYTFFNSFIYADSVKMFNLSDTPDFSYIFEDTTAIFDDTAIFTKQDIHFIKLQIAKDVKLNWRHNKIIGANIISGKRISSMFGNNIDIGWAIFNKQYRGWFATFSVPLFSLNRNICIVYKAWHCGGLCGNGNTTVYKKVNGKWILLKLYGVIWVS